MNRTLKEFLLLSPLLLLVQVASLGTGDIGLHVGLGTSHLFLLYVGLAFVRPRSSALFALYLAGYLLMFLGLRAYPLQHRELMLVLFALLYAATFHTPLLFGYLQIFFLSYVVFPLYAFAEFATGVLLYTGFYAVARRHLGLVYGYVLLFLALWIGFGEYAGWLFLPGALILTGVYARRRKDGGVFEAVCFLAGCVLAAFLLLPLIHLLQASSPQDVAGTWRENPDVRTAIWRSLGTSTAATLIAAVFGIPLAYVLARTEFVGRGVLLTFLDIPLVIPQPIVALALLQVLGEKSTLGEWMSKSLGIHFSGALAGIVAAQVFVSSPFLVRTAFAAFQDVDPRLEHVARTLGASAFSAFWRVALPLAAGGIFSGAILAWSRAVSEFGSVLILAEYPETAPVMVYHLFIRHGTGAQTLPAVVLLVLACLWVFLGLYVVRGFGRGWAAGRRGDGERD